MTALVCGDADAAEGSVCPPPGATWLRIALVGEGFEAPLRDGVIGLIGADLRARQVVLCEADAPVSASPPLADIDLTLTTASVLSIDVRDAVTDKRMTRELPLGSVPGDALALSIALAAEELLRASWIEAALAHARPAGQVVIAQPVPAAVRAVNAEEVTRMAQDARLSAARPMSAQAAVLGAFERATGGGGVRGQTDFGADLRLAWGGRLAFTARGGLRAAVDVASSHGTVQALELIVGFGIGYGLVPRDAAWGGEIGARADVVDVQFSGIDAAGAQATSGSALGALLSGTLGGWRRLGGGPWRIVAETAVGAPLRAVTAKDGGAATTGVSGLTFGGALGVAVTLGE